jgi:hypothetical protein
LNSGSSWKLKLEDGTIEEFIDIRRKVGNRILRAYLLDPLLRADRVDTLKASLRGPKNEFQDFDKYLILSVNYEGMRFRLLAESGVYENLRLVATDSEEIANRNSDELERAFTGALQDFDRWQARLVISPDSRVKKK